MIAEKYQHCGYAYEALTCLIKRYLCDEELYLLEAKYNENNIASSKLLNKSKLHYGEEELTGFQGSEII